MLELRPNEHSAAVSLLNLIPQDDEQQAIWVTLGDSLCDAESMSDITSLRQIRDRLPRDLARAVLLAQEMLPAYVAYAMVSTQDSHNDYALRMELVCRTKHEQFIKAAGGMPPEKRT